MSTVRIAGFAAAACFVASSGFAQHINTRSSDTPKANAKAGMTTVTGCLMKESDYRSAHGFGKGTLGGAGLGDEYVLVDASVMPNAGASTSSTSSSTPAATSTSPSASASCSETGSGLAYRTTGPREKEMQPLVGQRVEVTGTLRHGGREAAAGKLPTEIRVASFGPAPAAVSEQAAAPSAAPAPTTEAQNTTQPPAPENPPAAANNTPVGTSGNLPKTAGEEPLIGLVGVMLLGAGISLKLLRRATA